MAHAVKISDAFQLVDNGGPTCRRSNCPSGRSSAKDNNSKSEIMKRTSKKITQSEEETEEDLRMLVRSKQSQRLPTIFEGLLCRSRSWEARFSQKEFRGKSFNWSYPISSWSVEFCENKRREQGRRPCEELSYSYNNILNVTVFDGKENIFANGPANDGADETFVSACIAEKAVLNKIDKMSKID